MIRLVLLTLIGCATHVTVTECRKSKDVSGVEIIDGVCLSKRTDRLVYRAKNNTHVYIGFDILKTGVADVYTWRIIDHSSGTYINSRYTMETMLAIDFRKQVTRKHVVGATGRRHAKTFKHRVERKMKHCKSIWKRKQKHCKLTAVKGLLVRLKMRNVSFDNLDGCKH